jgi:hypothetical protein
VIEPSGFTVTVPWLGPWPAATVTTGVPSKLSLASTGVVTGVPA